MLGSSLGMTFVDYPKDPRRELALHSNRQLASKVLSCKTNRATPGSMLLACSKSSKNGIQGNKTNDGGRHESRSIAIIGKSSGALQ